MHRFLKPIVSFMDELLEIFDEELLAWCCLGVFLLAFAVGALFFAPLEGLIGGAALAVAAHMFVSEWQTAAERRHLFRDRARSVFIDTSALRSYSPSSSSRQP